MQTAGRLGPPQRMAVPGATKAAVIGKATHTMAAAAVVGLVSVGEARVAIGTKAGMLASRRRLVPTVAAHKVPTVAAHKVPTVRRPRTVASGAGTGTRLYFVF